MRFYFGKLSVGLLQLIHSSPRVSVNVSRYPLCQTFGRGHKVCTLPSLALNEKNSLPSLLSRQGVHKKNRTEVSAVSIFAFKWCARGFCCLMLCIIYYPFVEETTRGLVTGRVKLRPDIENPSLTITSESKRTTEQGSIKCKLL